MSEMRTTWLWVVIGVEVAVIIGLIGWALLRPHTATAPAVTKTITQPTTYKTPIITPVLYAEGLSAPTAIAAPSADDDRLFVTERPGTVKLVDSKGKAQPALDITAKVKDDGSEMGLLGIAAHPKFKTNHYLYLNYTNKQQETIVARYTFDTATQKIKADSEKVILTQPQPFPNHNGGQVAFGPDGYLYIGLGDGGSGGDPGDRAQNLKTWLGKILRIDVDHGDPYTTPADNPFVGDKDAKQEIWAYGLRNPWRFSFDAKTHDMYIGDVGQGLYEEINFQASSTKSGQNYGWRCYEGVHEFNTQGCQDASHYVMPVAEYAHSKDPPRCSVTGGYVYRGTKEPALVAKYFYADYCSGEIWYTKPSTDPWQSTLSIDTDSAISTFGQGGDGELYFADLKAGKLYHITDTAN